MTQMYTKALFMKDATTAEKWLREFCGYEHGPHYTAEWIAHMAADLVGYYVDNYSDNMGEPVGELTVDRQADDDPMRGIVLVRDRAYPVGVDLYTDAEGTVWAEHDAFC